MIVEVSVISLGVGESQSEYVSEFVRLLKEKGVKFSINPMGTVLEVENFKELADLLDEAVKRLENKGVPRVYIVVKADWRKAHRSMEEKVVSVLEKLTDRP
ncbi:MTH1187 family thiamine-binding protein [Archaeoglobus sp.]